MLSPPGSDSAAAALRAAGVPDAAGLTHAADVLGARSLWDRFISGGRRDPKLLARVCKAVLADKTVQGAELGTSNRAIRAAARAWTAAQVRQFRAGDWDALRRLTTFTTWSELGHEAFGIGSEQLALWELLEAREYWARAQYGDGYAAFTVVCHCSDGNDSYELVTGLPAGRAAARLQAVIDDYAARLRRQAETAASPRLGMPAFRRLRAFTGTVSCLNERAQRLYGRPLVSLPREPDCDWWRELCGRYADDDA